MGTDPSSMGASTIRSTATIRDFMVGQKLITILWSDQNVI